MTTELCDSPAMRLAVQLAGWLALGLLIAAPYRAVAASCSGEALVDVTLPGGARWELCWELRNEEGVVLQEVSYQAPGSPLRRVLKEAALAQINVAYDDGSTSKRQLTDPAAGLGNNIHSLAGTDCPGGTLHQDNGSAVLCVRVAPRGYAYKSYVNVKQGNLLLLESRSTIGAHSYIVRWNLYDDGSIEPRVGMSGSLPIIGSNANHGWQLDQSNRIGVGFNTSYFFRLDFDLDATNNNESVEEFTVTPSTDRLEKSLSVTTLTTETARTVSPNLKRSWRVRDKTGGVTNSDGRSISYHLEPLHTAHRYIGSSSESWAQNDFWVSKYNSCERFVVDNPGTGGCASDINGFLNDENIDGADVVIWYKINYHHLPRSEDEPEVQLHWDGFFIVPRDWTASNPLVSLIIHPQAGTPAAGSA
ncbi:MAG: hypothetical protein HKO60_04690 [Pseudomonadales bacterium]|nr:hypothetical protein [Pseudomonadales bacterium]NNL11968.1 hypothetical protein [Pseudomonadales bacterium]NNM11203.1 hypothetical protein [Pseudomonadales bacterium]